MVYDETTIFQTEKVASKKSWFMLAQNPMRNSEKLQKNTCAYWGKSDSTSCYLFQIKGYTPFIYYLHIKFQST